MNSSTIVALATAAGEGGLAVIRVSGPQAFVVAADVFEGRGFGAKPEARRAVYGILKYPNDGLPDNKAGGYIIDQAVALPFRGPHSYTGEDTVEFFCHGGTEVSRAVIAACRAAGAEPAAAGEFTRRAFLNGKLSLDQAEAVADLIQAQSARSARAAVRQLLGGFDSQLVAVEAPLLDLLARIEGSLEFVEEEGVAVPRPEIISVLEGAVQQLAELLAMAPAGRLLREGIHVVLAGAPNAGKSSLFNALLAEDRAIVDDEAGTTRDVVSAKLRRDGAVFVLHDTAGLREAAGRVEQMGIERTWRQVAEADIVLALTVSGESAEVLLPGCEAPVVPVLTKSDLCGSVECAPGGIMVSAVTGEGLPELWRAIDEVVAGFRLAEAASLGVVLNERHLHKLTACRDELSRLRDEVEKGVPGDEIVGSLLSSILSGLGEISGRVFSEQLLENIFQRFCVGK